MEQKKFCDRCGRLYTGKKCTCKTDMPKKKRQYNNKTHDTFYDGTYWKALRNAVRVRDFNTDRMALCCAKYGSVDQLINLQNYDPLTAFDMRNAYNLIHDLVIDESGQPKQNTGRLLVHHIKTRFECPDRQYDMDNLITLGNDTHEFVHMIYNTHRKEALQTLLLAVVQAQLP